MPWITELWIENANKICSEKIKKWREKRDELKLSHQFEIGHTNTYCTLPYVSFSWHTMRQSWSCWRTIDEHCNILDVNCNQISIMTSHNTEPFHPCLTYTHQNEDHLYHSCFYYTRSCCLSFLSFSHENVSFSHENVSCK